MAISSTLYTSSMLETSLTSRTSSTAASSIPTCAAQSAMDGCISGKTHWLSKCLKAPKTCTCRALGEIVECYSFCPSDPLVNQAKQNYTLASCGLSSLSNSTAPPPQWTEGSRPGHQNDILHEPGKLAGIFIGATLAASILLFCLVTFAFRIRRNRKSKAGKREGVTEEGGIENVLRLEVGMGGEIKRKINDDGQRTGVESEVEESDLEESNEDEADTQGTDIERQDKVEENERQVAKWENEVAGEGAKKAP